MKLENAEKIVEGLWEISSVEEKVALIKRFNFIKDTGKVSKLIEKALNDESKEVQKAMGEEISIAIERAIERELLG